MYSRFFHCLPALLVLALCTSSATGQARRSIAPDYITDDTFFILVIHPQKVMSHVGKDNETVKFLQEQIVDNSGLDVSKMTQFALLLGGPKDSQSDDTIVAVVMQFSEKVDSIEVAESMFSFADYGEAKLEGAEILKPNERQGPSFWNPDGKTIVLALEERLAGIIKNSKGMPTETDLSRKISADADCAFAVNLQELSDIRKRMIADMTEMWAPEELNVEEYAKVAKTCAFSIHASDNIPAKLEFEAIDEGSKDQLKTLVDSTWKALLASMQNAEADLKENMPEQMQSTADSLTAAFKIFKSEGNVVSSGSNVSIQIERMQGFKEAAELIVEGVAAPFRFFSAF